MPTRPISSRSKAPTTSNSDLGQPEQLTPDARKRGSVIVSTPVTPITDPSGSSRPSRTLRARVSDAAPSSAKRPRTTGTRIITTDEEARAIWKLSAEGTAARRDEVVQDIEARIRSLVEKHDMAVKEKFHLERYVSILEGWNPEDAKHDNSAVFLNYKHSHHDLLSLVPTSIVSSSSEAGPSRRRPAGTARTTRRQLQQKSEALGHITAIGTPKSKEMKANGETEVDLGNGKGKAKATEETEQEELVAPSKATEPKRKGKSDMAPPPVPGRKSSRAPTHRAAELGEETVEEEESSKKGKKRTGRQSLPNIPSKRSRLGTGTAASSPASSPAPTTPAAAREPTPEPPAPLPSLAHLPFPPPPRRPPFRPNGPVGIRYTDPNQRPPTPKFGRDVNALLESYILLEDTGNPLDLSTLQARAAREAYIRNRVNWLQHQGRLMRLLDEDNEVPDKDKRNSRHERKIPTGPPPRQTDFQDSLITHMIQVRNAVVAEAKLKPIVCKKIAKMIQLYWEHILTKDERERMAEERERKRKAKEVVKALKKRWGLAIKIIRAKVREEQKLEQDRLGKEHLQNMLQRSTGLLEGQLGAMTRPDDAEDGDEGAESDGTADISAADDSEAEGGEHGGDEEDGDGEDTGIDVEVEVDDDDTSAKEQEPHDDEEDGSDDDDFDKDGSDESDIEGMPRVDYHAMLGIKREEISVDEVAEAIEAEVPESIDTDVASPLVNELEVNVGEPKTAQEAESAKSTTLSSPTEAKFVAEIAIDKMVASPNPPSTSKTAGLSTATRDDSAAAPSAATADNTTPLTSAIDASPAAYAPAFPTGDSRKDVSPTRSSSPIPLPRAPSRRLARKTRELAAAAATPDPDADDIDFRAHKTDPADAQLDDEMEDTKADGGDSEDEGLLADAEMPIEELLKRYGYPILSAPKTEAQENTEAAEVGDEVVADEVTMTERKPTVEDTNQLPESSIDDGAIPAPNVAEESALQVYDTPDAGAAARGAASTTVQADQSLTDEALSHRRPSPSSLIIEGKRQRRPRTIWTPPDTPQHAVSNKPRKPKAKGVVSAPEPEPSEAEDDGEDEEEEESEEESEGTDEDVGSAADAKSPAAEGDSTIPGIRPPFLLRGTLRPYQQAGLEWLASLYATNMNGILADEMGLGKTIQTIALLGHLACDKGVWGPHLIIVPTSVILNWEMEFKKFLPGMKVLTYYGNQKERKEKRVGWNTENAWQVCITSYQIVLADQHIFRRKNWVYMILDEAHNIKNFRSQRWQTLLGFKTQRRLLLTGTPLQNNLMELWSLLYFLMPNGITADATAVVGFANHRDFMDWFSNPMDKAVESGDTLDEETIETVSKLHTLLRPFILRRLKADVETQLPGKYEHVVYCRLSKRQRFLYDEFMSRASTREALASGGYMGVMNTLMQLRKVCNHPDLFEVRPVRTSFATDRGVLSDFEPTDLLVRRRLLAQHDELNLDALGLLVTSHEDESGFVSRGRKQLDASHLLPHAMEPAKFGSAPRADLRTVAGWKKHRAFVDHKAEVARWHLLRDINKRRCSTGTPVYGRTTLDMLMDLPRYLLPESVQSRRRMDWFAEHLPPAAALVQSLPDRLESVTELVNRFAVIPPNAVARNVARYALPGLDPLDPTLQDPKFDTLHVPSVKLQIAFPDVSLLQYDCGKLQKLAEMLRDLKADGHRILIFTQMTRVLDILEIFLSYNGHRYLRLDGSTKIEDRQVLTERFNSDSRIFCFIASSRSGGVGINLTGADTVFFYDSDWNPSMDRQCMDRAHRIGQTREVHIYRFVSSHTVEENMLKKANQKRLLDRVVIQDGEFTTDFFGKMDWRDTLDDSMLPPDEDEEEDRIEDVAVEEMGEEEDVTATAPRLGQERDLALALAQVEDEEDAAAARIAQGEGEMDFADFGDETKKSRKDKEQSAPGTPAAGGAAMSNPAVSRLGTEPAKDTPSRASVAASVPLVQHSESATPFPDDRDEYYDDDEPGAIDEYMLRYVEWEWDTYFCHL